MWWLYAAFWVSVGALIGFSVGASVVARQKREREDFWRNHALDLQFRVHELEGR